MGLFGGIFGGNKNPMENKKGSFDAKKFLTDSAKILAIYVALGFGGPEASAQSFNVMDMATTKNASMELANFKEAGQSFEAQDTLGNRYKFDVNEKASVREQGYHLTVTGKDGSVIDYFDINMDGSVDRVKGKYKNGGELDLTLPSPETLSKEELNSQVGTNVKAYNVKYRDGVKLVEDATKTAVMTASVGK